MSLKNPNAEMDDDLVELLDCLPGQEKEAALQERFRTPEFCARLLKRIDEIQQIDPHAAMPAARLAIRLTSRLKNSTFGQAWAVWASVNRALGHYDQAELGHRMASIFLDTPVDLAWLHRRRAYLMRDQGRFAEARVEIGPALSIYSGRGDLSSRACTLVDLSTIHLAEGRYDDANFRLYEALKYLNPDKEPCYHASALYNLSVALIYCDRPGTQFEHLLKTTRQNHYEPGSLPWAQHRWLEGLVFRRRSRLRLAENSFRAARNQLLRLKALHDVGLVTMDLAEFYLETGDWEKVLKVLRKLIPLFQELNLDAAIITASQRCLEAALSKTLKLQQMRHVRKKFWNHVTCKKQLICSSS